MDGHAILPRRIEPATATWAGPLLEARLDIALVGPLFVEAGIQGIIAVPAPQFRLLELPNPIATYQASSLVGIGFLGVGVHF